jgi:hypothetical protein
MTKDRRALQTASDRPPVKLVLVAALLPLVLLGAAFLGIGA